MCEVIQSRSEDTSDAITSKIRGILNPSMHHHDLLQSYVRTPEESVSYSKLSEDAKNFDQNPVLETSSEIMFHDSVSNESRVGGIKTKKTEDKKQQNEKSDKLSVESEVNIQKKKKRHRQTNGARRQEEVYTDKDRAAAVNMGTRDIKQSLKIKQKQDRDVQLPENTEPSAMLALGLREIQIGDVKVAMNCINKALNLGPNDSNALIARSKCHLLLGEPRKAMQDAENALRYKMKNTNVSKALYCKAEGLYHLGHFEMSLVYYYRGMKIRPECEQFRFGVQKATHAIQNVLRKK